MAAATDGAILEHARSKQLTVVTLDADFHALLAWSGASRPSVIRFRAQGLKAGEACVLIESVVARVEQELDAGVLVSATRERVRIERLPIGR